MTDFPLNIWPKGRLNTRAHDFDLDQELVWQKDWLAENPSCPERRRHARENIAAIEREQLRRKQDEQWRDLRLSRPSR